jgi:hypothetical protein
VQLTQNHGATWTDLTPALVAAGAKADRWVSRVFASPLDAGTAFVSKTGFRNDDFAPYLYKTTDYGKTWTSIAGNLPNYPINVVVQDRKHGDLLIVGNDVGVFVSINGGGAWARLKANLPDAAVHDLTIHPRENDLVIGTYGRAIFAGDITPLQELTAALLDKPVHLFDIEPKARYGFSTQGANYPLFGDKYIEVPNEPDAVAILYYLKADASPAPRVTITDAAGRTVRQLDGPGRAGLNRLNVPFTGGGRGRGAGTAAAPANLAPGEYVVTLTAAGQTLTKPARVRERIR